MPRVASKLSLSHSPTAWMQPRTWITSSSSRRWNRVERSVTVFIDILGFGEMLFLAFAPSCKWSRKRSVWELICWIGAFPGFFSQKNVAGSYGPYAWRYCGSAATQPRGHPRKPQSTFCPTHEPQNTAQDQNFLGVI